MKHEELCKLMAWKLMVRRNIFIMPLRWRVQYLFFCFLQRGKFRPRLTELIRGNSPESVESVTREGLSLLPNLKRAVEVLCQLKGVGPATASGVWYVCRACYRIFERP